MKKLLPIFFLLILPLISVPRVYAVSDIPYSHPVNPADTCVPTGLETWGLVGVTTDSFAYGFPSATMVIGEFSSDFTGKLVSSISFSLCGYKNDTVTDSNPVKIGIYNQADGSLRQLIGSVSFDSLPICTLFQDGTHNTCASKQPALVTANTQTYITQDMHSPGGVDYIGVSFPAHSAVGHDVLVFCSNNCSNSVVSHGGICNPISPSNSMCHTGGSVTVSPGSAMAGSISFGRITDSNALATAGSIPIIAVIIVIVALFVMIVTMVFVLKNSEDAMESATSIIILFVISAVVTIMGVGFIVSIATGVGGLP